MKRVVCMMAVSWLVLAMGTGWANNLQITNVTVTPRDETTALVQFDISWENSWRYTNINHDAAWVFFKVQQDNSGDLSDYMHVILEGTGTNPTDYVVGTGTPIEMIVPADRVGMIVRRSGEGVGTTSVQNVKAVWNFASNSIPRSGKVKMQAFGVEMVYVAQGAFKVGSGGTGSGELYEGGGGTSPFAITNAGPIPCSNLVGCLWGASTSGNNSMGGNGTLSSSFPNGYNAFYCMKYEITQGQYADFLNTLTRGQQEMRVTATTLNYYFSATAAGGSASIVRRNTVRLTSDPGGGARREYTTTRRDRACNFLSWADGAAFADWAGLRPMTELEYEKACRGPLNPVANEYAWGTATIMADAARAISGTEDGTETITNDTSSGGCNYGYKNHTGGDTGDGPLRVGIFATAASSRILAGASYWGIMDLSGNVWERSVTIGDATGRAFTGLHGNGDLAVNGDANVTAWPNAAAAGSGFRGGSWLRASTLAPVSDRTQAAFGFASRENATGNENSGGGRAVRTAP